MRSISKEEIINAIPEALKTKGESLKRFKPHYIGFFYSFTTDFLVNNKKVNLTLGTAIAKTIKGDKVTIFKTTKVEEKIIEDAKGIEVVENDKTIAPKESYKERKLREQKIKEEVK